MFLVFSVFLSSCSTNKYSQSDINKYLTSKRVSAKTSPISVLVPQGWHEVDANNEEFIDLWLVRNDLNVSLSLLPFHSNSTANNLNGNYETSILFQKTKYKNSITINKEKPIQLNDKVVLPYNFSVNGKNYRTIVFEHNEKFYELTLFGENTNIKIEYFIQELVISSVK
jgi:hypothetical protein